MKGVHHSSIKGKLAPRYIGLYPIIDRYGLLSYQVELPSKLSGVYNVFHVSQLKSCLKPPTDVIVEDTIPLEPNLTYKAYAIMILDQQNQVRGMTTQRMKPRGNMRTSYDPTIQSVSHQGKNPNLTLHYTFTKISGQDSF
jgi:hypothetical protein